MASQAQFTGAIIVAAGTSQRMAGVDKSLALVNGKPLIALTVDLFEVSPWINATVVVAARHNIEAITALSDEKIWNKVTKIVIGGERRQDSVRLGLKALPSCDWVVIHDGARPLMPERLLKDGLEAARATGASTAAITIKDTIKVIDDDGNVIETPTRANTRSIQTPQIFRRDILERAHNSVLATVTDDASMVESIGVPVKIFPGDEINFKVTTPIDLLLANAILAEGTRAKS